MLKAVLSLAVADTTAAADKLTDGVSQFAENASQAADDFSKGMDSALEKSQIVSSVKQWTGEGALEKLWELLPSIIIAALTIVLGVILTKVTARLVIKGMKKRGTDPSVYNFVETIVKVTIMLIVVISALSSLGLNLNSFIAALASAGVAIGLGLQSSVSQFASGIMIILNKPFKKGDFVEVKGVSGSVSEINIMNTVLLTADNKKIIMPNSDITANHIINYSAEEKRRCDITFGISYADDIAKAKSVILSEVGKNEKALGDPAPAVLVSGQEASCIQLTLRCWCLNENYWDLYFALQERVKLAFDENGIDIPFNQLDVHVINQ
ncbi:MAG: mechanosensitive ion channel family protein [Acutalibacteraceae bacterium]|nr:mechanosensitive ion channel [Oscillospiraceae bacterium]